MNPTRATSSAGPLVAALLALHAAPRASETLPGPVPATVLEVIDGDTVKLRAHIWLGQEVETAVRLDGIDTPELRGGCAAERRLAAAARDLLVRLVGDGRVSLRDIAQDKYGGRVVAKIADMGGRDLGATLLATGLARPYNGGARGSWC